MAKEAGQWLGSSPLGRRAGTSFQKFIGASKPRFDGLHSESAGRVGNEIGAEHDEEYVFVDPRGFRDVGTLVLPPNVFPQSEVPSPRPEGRDVAGDKPSADAVTSDALCSVDVEKKKKGFFCWNFWCWKSVRRRFCQDFEVFDGNGCLDALPDVFLI